MSEEKPEATTTASQTTEREEGSTDKEEGLFIYPKDRDELTNFLDRVLQGNPEDKSVPTLDFFIRYRDRMFSVSGLFMKTTVVPGTKR